MIRWDGNYDPSLTEDERQKLIISQLTDVVYHNNTSIAISYVLILILFLIHIFE